MPERLAWSIPEAARRAGFGRTKLYELIAAGTVPTVTVGSRRLVRDADLVAYLDGLPTSRPGDAA